MDGIALAEIAAGEPTVSWGVAVHDAATGQVVASYQPHQVMATASVGKLLLLTELAARVGRGTADLTTPLDRTRVAPVADSGLWQHLATDVLPVADVAALVGQCSDNLATNVLIDHVGLSAVRLCGDRLGLEDTRLLDIVRDHRRTYDPPALSTGTAAELAGLMCRLVRDDVGVRGTGPMVLRWLALGTDLSMAAAAFGLDPLAHTGADRGWRLINKTGTDEGVRADVGVVHGPARSLAYAVLANSPATSSDGWPRDDVLATMRRVGELIRDAAEQ